MIIENEKDTVVDTLAKMLVPEGYPNWHMYRDYARGLLAPAARLQPGELASIMAASDREVTVEELREGEDARLAALGLARLGA